MRVIERATSWYGQLSPRRQKAVEYFAWSGFGMVLAGVSVVPLVEGGVGTTIGAVGIAEGTLASVALWKWGWQALREARLEEARN